MLPPPPISTLFPYTTLFRSLEIAGRAGPHGRGRDRAGEGEPARVGARVERSLKLDNADGAGGVGDEREQDRKSTRLNSSHRCISYAVFCLKKKKKKN